jgi:hypothetical protein
MEFTITGISEPQLDKNGNNHIRLYSQDIWTTDENGKKSVTSGKTLFIYNEEQFDDFEINETITVNQ